MSIQNKTPSSGKLQGETTKDSKLCNTPIITNSSKKCQTQAKSKAGTYKGEARPAKRLVVTEGARELLEGKLSGCPAKALADTSQLFYHLIASSGRLDFIPLPYPFIQQYFRKSDMAWLISSGLVESDGYYIQNVKCLKYKVNEDFLVEYHEMLLKDMMAGRTELFDLVKQRGVKVGLKSKLTDENGNELPQLIQDRIKSYGVCKFNKSNAYKIVEKRRLESQEVLSKHGKRSAEYITARAKYKCDLSAFTHVLIDCGAVDIGGGLSAYIPPYENQKSGRITHMMGGFQAASREFTAAAFYGIEDYHNYDLVSAQSRLMRQIMREFGFETTFLDDYTANPKSKHIYAAQVGVEAQQIKDMIHSALMGTQLLEPCDAIKRKFISIAKYRPYWEYCRLTGKPLLDEKTGKPKPAPKAPAFIEVLLEYFSNDGEKAYAAFERFYQCCAVLFKELKIFHAWVHDVIQGKVKQDWFVKNAGRRFVRNRAGMPLPLEEKKDGEEVNINNPVSKAIAHMLQGAEACWISHLLRLAPKYGFRPVQDFHDGFISEGEVPLEAQEEASKLSGLEGVLETKPFENPFPEGEKVGLIFSYPVEVVFEEDMELNKLVEELGLGALGCYFDESPFYERGIFKTNKLDNRSLN